jgi:hypothetical protein
VCCEAARDTRLLRAGARLPRNALAILIVDEVDGGYQSRLYTSLDLRSG